MAILRLSFGGSLYADIWECTLHMEGNFPIGTYPVGGALLDDCADDVKQWFQKGHFISYATLAYVKLNEIDPQTRAYTSKTETHEKRWDTPIAGSESSVQLPQLSVCVSLLTDAKRGAAARGRFYPPPSTVLNAIDATGHLSSRDLDDYASNARDLIKNLNNHPGIDNPLGNDSNVVVLGKGGATRRVTRVSVGNVVDTQRRRRSAIKEAYTIKDGV